MENETTAPKMLDAMTILSARHQSMSGAIPVADYIKILEDVLNEQENMQDVAILVSAMASLSAATLRIAARESDADVDTLLARIGYSLNVGNVS